MPTSSSFKFAALLAGVASAAAKGWDCDSMTMDPDFTHTAYISDVKCLMDRGEKSGFSIDTDIEILKEPEKHTKACMFGMAACKESGYFVLSEEKNASTAKYTMEYKMGWGARAQIETIFETSTMTNNYKVKLTGGVTKESGQGGSVWDCGKVELIDPDTGEVLDSVADLLALAKQHNKKCKETNAECSEYKATLEKLKPKCADVDTDGTDSATGTGTGGGGGNGMGGGGGGGLKLSAKNFQKYDGYTGTLVVGGTVGPMTTAGTTQTFDYSLTGTDPACSSGADPLVANSCGVHIHSGTSCDDAANVGGHFFTGTVTEDPWKTIAYTSGSDGAASDTGVSVNTGATAAEANGKAMVIHDHTGARIACTLLAGQTTRSRRDHHAASCKEYAELATEAGDNAENGSARASTSMMVAIFASLATMATLCF